MDLRKLLFGLILFVLLSTLLNANQIPVQGDQPKILTIESLDAVYDIDQGWRYFRGDDENFALPELDDRNWEHTALQDFSPIPKPSEVIWFRKEIVIKDTSSTSVLAIAVETYGIVDVFFDGFPVQVMDHDGWGEFIQIPTPRIVHPANPSRHVVAVRCDPGKAPRYLQSVGSSNPVGFNIQIGSYQQLMNDSIRRDNRIGRMLFLSGLLFAASLTAGLITLRLPLLTLNRAFFGFTISGSTLLLLLQLFRSSISAQNVVWLILGMELLVVGTFISAILFLQEATGQHRPKTMIFLTAFSIAGIATALLTRIDVTFIHYLLFAFELIRTLAIAVWRPNRGTFFVAFGFLLFLIAEVLHWASFWGVIPHFLPGWVLSLVAILSPTFAMIALFVFRYADLHWEVQNKIRRMQELSARTILHEQQLRTKEREALELKAKFDRERLNTVQKLAIAIAHEFNSPLTTLALMAETLLRPSSNDELKRETINRLPHLIDRLRMLTGKLRKLRTLKEVDYVAGIKMLDLNHSEIPEEIHTEEEESPN